MPNGTQLSEIVLTHSTMTTDDRQKLEGYLAWKWGLTYALPNSHPYKWDSSLFGGADQNGFDADAKTYITAVETADTRDLETSVREAINTFVVGCKADGIWNAIKASCIMAGARTLAGALQPLVGTAPTNFNFVAGDYDRKTGLKGDGSTKYLNSNRDNNADPQNSNHNSVFMATTGVGIYMGSSTSAAGQNALGSGISRSRSNTSSGAGGVGALGFNGMSRSVGSSYTVRAGGANTGIAIASSAPASANVFVFARHNAGVPSTFTDARLAFYSIGESINLALLDARVTTLLSRMAFAINTGLNPVGYDGDTIAYVNAGYAAGGTLS